ncbi:MAG TPA: hypothetical protein VJL27_03300 [Patescibacteria group bacterium]|nr:hypothetical protein [Patescibacteria group bacterium]
MTTGQRTIAIDADNVIVDTTSPLLDFYRATRNPSSRVTVADCHTYNLWEVWDCPREEAIRVVMAYFGSEQAMAALPIPGAQEALLVLKERFKLVVVTARRSEFAPMTMDWLDRYFSGIFDDVLFANHFAVEGTEIPKADLCRQVGARVLIDDQIDHLVLCQKADITGILFGRYPWQRGAELPEIILRAPDWPAVLAHLTQ